MHCFVLRRSAIAFGAIHQRESAVVVPALNITVPPPSRQMARWRPTTGPQALKSP